MAKPIQLFVAGDASMPEKVLSTFHSDFELLSFFHRNEKYVLAKARQHGRRHGKTKVILRSNTTALYLEVPVS